MRVQRMSKILNTLLLLILLIFYTAYGDAEEIKRELLGGEVLENESVANQVWRKYVRVEKRGG